MSRHLSERYSFSGFRIADDLAGVIVRNETLRNDIEQADCDEKQHTANRQRQRAMLERDFQGPAITANQPFVSTLRLLPELSVLERGRSGGILARIIVVGDALRNGRAIARSAVVPMA